MNMLALSGAKSVLLSKTFWGALVTFLAAVVPTIIHGITSEDIMTISSGLIGLAGSIYAVYGRIAANQHVTLTLPKGD
jgi:hypothetical protein